LSKPRSYRFSTASRTANEKSYMAHAGEFFDSAPFTTLEKLMNFPM
jgi:hypothetical protein